MKCILIGSTQNDLLPTLESFLKHWGHRVLYSQAEKPFLALFETLHPDLLIVDRDFLGRTGPELQETLMSHLSEGPLPMIMLVDEDDRGEHAFHPHSHPLSVPLDIFELYRLTQKLLQTTPRQRLRLDVRLPSMFAIGDGPTQIGEILTVSEGGMFLKTSLPMNAGQELKIYLPLMGMGKELELDAQVLYPILPTQKNRYLQGFGIEFIHLTPQEQEHLRNFIENAFLEKVSEAFADDELPHDPQLRRHSDN